MSVAFVFNGPEAIPEEVRAKQHNMMLRKCVRDTLKRDENKTKYKIVNQIAIIMGEDPEDLPATPKLSKYRSQRTTRFDRENSRGRGRGRGRGGRNNRRDSRGRGNYSNNVRGSRDLYITKPMNRSRMTFKPSESKSEEFKDCGDVNSIWHNNTMKVAKSQSTQSSQNKDEKDEAKMTYLSQATKHQKSIVQSEPSKKVVQNNPSNEADSGNVDVSNIIIPKNVKNKVELDPKELPKSGSKESAETINKPAITPLKSSTPKLNLSLEDFLKSVKT